MVALVRNAKCEEAVPPLLRGLSLLMMETPSYVRMSRTSQRLGKVLRLRGKPCCCVRRIIRQTGYRTGVLAGRNPNGKALMVNNM